MLARFVLLRVQNYYKGYLLNFGDFSQACVIFDPLSSSRPGGGPSASAAEQKGPERPGQFPAAVC